MQSSRWLPTTCESAPQQSLLAQLWAIWKVWLIWLAFGLSSAQAQGVPEGTLRFQKAERLMWTGASEGIVSLPDADAAHRIQKPTTRIYRVRFQREALDRVMGGANDLVGVLVPRACSTLTLRLNGSTIYETQQRRIMRFNECGAPRLGAISWSLLKPGENVMDMEVTGWPRDWVSTSRREFFLSDVMVGSYPHLHRVQQQITTVEVDIPAMSVGALLVLATLSVCLLVFAPREPHLAYFASLCVLLCAVGAHGVWALPLDNPVLREGVPVVLLAAMAWTYQRFVCLYADLSAPRLTQAALLLFFLAPVGIAAAGNEHLFAVASAVGIGSAMMVLASTWLFLRHAEVPRRRPMKAVGAVLAVATVLLCMELMVSLEWVSSDPLVSVRWGVPLCMLTLGALQMLHFARQSYQLEVAQRDLEQKVASAREEIEANFTRLAEARIEQVTAGERKRIAGDLHDDLGAKLLTIVHTSRSDRIAALAREALDEMRLSVRGLTGRPMELSDALADWRTEAISRLSVTGVELDWPLPEGELRQVLGSRTMVQTTRILREIFNNIIRHSQASRCEVRTLIQGQLLTIEVSDNGIGFDIDRLQEKQAGLGLLNMSHRARQLRGECVIESRIGEGSRTQLTLPLDSSAG